EVGGEQYARARIDGVFERRDLGADARVTGDDPILNGDVQIRPDQKALVLQIQIGHPQNAHLTLDHARATSSIRLENPHSLSYQAQTLTSVPPMTLVSVASKLAEWGSWLKSTDTSGSVL